MDWLKKIYDLLNDKINDNNSISDGSTRIPYQETTVTIAAGARTDFFLTYNYFRVLALSASTLSVRFGQNGLETPYSGQGVGCNFNETYGRLTLINTGGASMVITFATADGSINDDRLNVSGTINTNAQARTAFTTTADVSILTTATTQVLAANTSRREALISNKATNGTVIRVGDASAGAARGVEVPIGATITIESTAALFVYNPSASTINVGLAEVV